MVFELLNLIMLGNGNRTKSGNIRNRPKITSGSGEGKVKLKIVLFRNNCVLGLVQNRVHWVELQNFIKC